jgi:hypothetical protein
MVVVVFRNKLYTVRSAASGWKFVDEDVRRAGAVDEKKGGERGGGGDKEKRTRFQIWKNVNGCAHLHTLTAAQATQANETMKTQGASEWLMRKSSKASERRGTIASGATYGIRLARENGWMAAKEERCKSNAAKIIILARYRTSRFKKTSFELRVDQRNNKNHP